MSDCVFTTNMNGLKTQYLPGSACGVVAGLSSESSTTSVSSGLSDLGSCGSAMTSDLSRSELTALSRSNE